MIIFAKICISNDYRGFILLFVHPAEKEKYFLDKPCILSCANKKLGCVERNCCAKGVAKGVEGKEKCLYKFCRSILLSGWLDSNQRPHAPQTRTLTGLSYIPNCECKSKALFLPDKIFPTFFIARGIFIEKCKAGGGLVLCFLFHSKPFFIFAYPKKYSYGKYKKFRTSSGCEPRRRWDAEPFRRGHR